MPVTRERFDQGMTYEQYKAQMTRNKERFEAVEKKVALQASDVATFKKLAQPLDVLVLAEDWCGDVISGLPVLGRLAAESGKLNIRVFLRDQNLDIMDQYLKEGKFRSIPVFIFFGENFKELGYLIERPTSVTDKLAERRRAVFAANPDFGSPETPPDQLSDEVRARYVQAMNAVRDELGPWMNNELVRSLREAAVPALV